MSVLQIDQLRRQLREKFPEAHRPPLPPEPSSPSSSPLVFASGHLSEIITPHHSSGASLVISEILKNTHNPPLALIDGRDSFDPASYGNTPCRHLIWIRCSRSEQALQAADLLLRDGNLPLIILDLHLVSSRELRRIPKTFWQRLKTQARDSGSSMLGINPQALIPSPHRRFTLNGKFSLDHLERHPPSLQFQQASDQQHIYKA